MRKRIAAGIVAAVMSMGGVAAVSSPVNAATGDEPYEEVHSGEGYEEEGMGLPAWQQRRIDRALRWLEWADAQIDAGEPEKAFQGFRQAVLQVRGFRAGEKIMAVATRQAFFMAQVQVVLGDEAAETEREEQLVRQARRLVGGCEDALEGGGALSGIEKCRRAFLRVSSFAPKFGRVN